MHLMMLSSSSSTTIIVATLDQTYSIGLMDSCMDRPPYRKANTEMQKRMNDEEDSGYQNVEVSRPNTKSYHLPIRDRCYDGKVKLAHQLGTGPEESYRLRSRIGILMSIGMSKCANILEIERSHRCI